MGYREVRVWPFMCLVILLVCGVVVLPTASLGDGGGFPKPVCNAGNCNVDCVGDTTNTCSTLGCNARSEECDVCECKNIALVGQWCDCATKGLEP